MGPIVLFDKSFLHSLSVDEAAVFDALFTSNITPLFFVETLADLRKEMSDGRTPEQVVGNLALKTPKLHSYPNMQHWDIAVSELMGQLIELRGVPLVAGGRAVRAGGKEGIIFDHPPEMTALHRWADGHFLEVERNFAAEWRAAVQSVPRGIDKILGPDGNKLRLSDLPAVAAMVDSLIDGPNRWIPLKSCMELFGLRLKQREQVAERWRRAGRPLLKDFAPYCAHVVRVELIYHLGVATGQLHDDRPSNRVDLAYLHYAPFCQIFVSGDKLHRRLAPTFLNQRQRFVWAHDLKSDLGKLVAHYRGHPDIATEGLMRVAAFPPLEGDFLATTLHDELHPTWRKAATAPKVELPPEKYAELRARLEAMKAEQPGQPGAMTLPPRGHSREADQITIERKVPLRWGRWQFMPADLEADCDQPGVQSGGFCP